MQKRFGSIRIFVDPRLDFFENLTPTALDHITEQRPGRTTKANQRHSPRQLLPRQRNSLVDIFQLGRYVYIFLHDGFVLRVLWALQGRGKMRSLFVEHHNLHAHCLRDNEDIREDDGGIYESGEAFNGLEGEGGRNFGVATCFEEVVGSFDYVVFGEVAASFGLLLEVSPRMMGRC